MIAACRVVVQSAALPLRLPQLQGAARVSVEQRATATEGFGQGRKVQMSFGEFVRRVAAGEELLYLSTQQVQTVVSAKPVLHAPGAGRRHCRQPLRRPLWAPTGTQRWSRAR